MLTLTAAGVLFVLACLLTLRRVVDDLHAIGDGLDTIKTTLAAIAE